KDAADMVPAVAIDLDEFVVACGVPGALVRGQGNERGSIIITEHVAKSLDAAARAILHFVKTAKVDIDSVARHFFEKFAKKVRVLEGNVVPGGADPDPAITRRNGGENG